LGVAVIVLLCIIFIVAYILLSSNPSEPYQKESFESKIVSGVLSVISDSGLKIENCKGISIKDALWQCFIEEKNDRIFCDDYDYNSDACNFSLTFIKEEILDPFLYQYGYDYKFNLLSESQRSIQSISNGDFNCKSNTGEIAKIATYSGSYYISLSICQ